MAASRLEDLAEVLNKCLGDAVTSSEIEFGELTLVIVPTRLLEVAKTLRKDPLFSFTQLSDISGVDYLTFGEADWQTQNEAVAINLNTTSLDGIGQKVEGDPKAYVRKPKHPKDIEEQEAS